MAPARHRQAAFTFWPEGGIKSRGILPFPTVVRQPSIKQNELLVAKWMRDCSMVNLHGELLIDPESHSITWPLHFNMAINDNEDVD